MRILCLLLLSLVSACTNQSLTITNGLLITNVTILTSEGDGFNPIVGDVIVDGGKIVHVGPEAPSVDGNFEHIDGTGKYLIPGLIDSHVHATEVQGMIFDHIEQYPEMVSAFRKQVPRSYLYYGFTTLINLGGISEEQLDFFEEQPLSPEIYHTGRSGASVANGYPMNFAPEQFRFESSPNFIYLESEAENIPEQYDPAEHTPEAVVSRIDASGGIAVKSYYERGFRGMPTLPVPSREIMQALQEEARARGLVLTVHANSLEAHAFLTEVGVDVLAHGLWNWGKYWEVPKDSFPDEIKQLLDMQIEKGIGYTPTLTVIEGEKALADSTFLDDPALGSVVPADLIEWYQTDEGQWFAADLFGDMAVEDVNRIYANIQGHAKSVLKYLSDHGGLILFGTDTPSSPTYTNQPGHNGYWEIQLMHEAGVPLEQILASATINNAKTFHLDSLIGSIAVGKKANMLLLAANPLEAIEAYDKIEQVLIDGQAIEREMLAVQD